MYTPSPPVLINTGVPAVVLALTLAGRLELVGGVTLVLLGGFNLLMRLRAGRQKTRSFPTG
ncbi:MAG TPA: hypothetical protein VGP46_07675 [Acidimicrobiales bacterium]|jgi:hypothetical protein|nr:hypothetical protein [Acidimicrobiales bacterium]